MKTYDVAQGSKEWFRARSAKVTASALSQIVTPSKLLAGSGKAYLYKLAAEKIIGRPVDEWDGNATTERGNELEDQARAWYEVENDCTVKEVGFAYNAEKRCGASADGLVGERGGVEIKIPLAHNHVKNVMDPAKFVQENRLQVQGTLWVYEGKRDWWDLVTWNPVIAPKAFRCYPDPEVFAALDSIVPKFLERVAETIEYLRLTGLGIDPDNMTMEDRELAMNPIA